MKRKKVKETKSKIHIRIVIKDISLLENKDLKNLERKESSFAWDFCWERNGQKQGFSQSSKISQFVVGLSSQVFATLFNFTKPAYFDNNLTIRTQIRIFRLEIYLDFYVLRH